MTMAILNLAGVCCGIAITCVIMTMIHTAVLLSSGCGANRSIPSSEAECQGITDEQLDYSSRISLNKGLLTALVVLYGVTAVVLNGVAMIYSFFLYRKVRIQPRNWLTNTNRTGHKVISTTIRPQMVSSV